MSDDKGNNEDFGALTNDDDDDGGFGNLPPLSDFDSGNADDDGDGGLPPIVDIKVDTPAVRPSDLDTPESNPAVDTPGGGFDTPAPGGLGFQDFSADSDFSPDTPDIGPGPDSDIETPMFDSAFGGNTDDFATPGGTPAPTQAMETPMFEAGGGQPASGIGFDNDAFGAPTPDTGGTPIPDFSPDTGVNAPVMNYTDGGGSGGDGGTNKILVAAVAIVMLIVGLGAGGYFSPTMDLGFIPNPPRDAAEADAKTALSNKDKVIREKDAKIDELALQITKGQIITPEEIAKLTEQFENLTADIESSSKELTQTNTSLKKAQSTLEKRNDSIATATTKLEDVRKKEAISKARNVGLKAENTQLVSSVGELEEADARRQATLDTLIHSANLLEVQIQGGSPLVPQRYSHKKRLAQAEALSAKVSRAKWVTPQLLNEYTDLYISELGIASSREYFFAKIPIHDSLGTKIDKWSECLMNGNWSVYFRTLDGNHVGTYENTAPNGTPKYAFREDLPEALKSDITGQITASRPEGYEEKFVILRGKDAIYDTETKVQKKFSSLLK